MNPEVAKTDREFSVKGYLTLSEIPPGVVSDRSSVVVADIVRATTTINAVLARGARAVQVVPKTYGIEVDNTPLRAGVPLICAGEQGGEPVPGGVFSNSALEVPQRVAGMHVRFYSTNSGSIINELTYQFVGTPTANLYLASMFNVDALASVIEDTGSEQLLVCAGGFYDRVSIEDAVAGGRLIKRLGLEDAALDDGATTMLALADRFQDDQVLIDAVSTNRVGRTLRRFGRAHDIPAAITGVGLDPHLAADLRHTIGQLTWLSTNTPVFERTTNTKRGKPK